MSDKNLPHKKSDELFEMRMSILFLAQLQFKNVKTWDDFQERIRNFPRESVAVRELMKRCDEEQTKVDNSLIL